MYLAGTSEENPGPPEVNATIRSKLRITLKVNNSIAANKIGRNWGMMIHKYALKAGIPSVSYTHLTLPTSDLV